MTRRVFKREGKGRKEEIARWKKPHRSSHIVFSSHSGNLARPGSLSSQASVASAAAALAGFLRGDTY